MSKPVIAQKSPIPVAVTAGDSYWWCACGMSRNQPFVMAPIKALNSAR